MSAEQAVDQPAAESLLTTIQAGVENLQRIHDIFNKLAIVQTDLDSYSLNVDDALAFVEKVKRPVKARIKAWVEESVQRDGYHPLHVAQAGYAALLLATEPGVMQRVDETWQEQDSVKSWLGVDIKLSRPSELDPNEHDVNTLWVVRPAALVFPEHPFGGGSLSKGLTIAGRITGLSTQEHGSINLEDAAYNFGADDIEPVGRVTVSEIFYSTLASANGFLDHYRFLSTIAMDPLPLENLASAT